jgi:hypothetical protein
MHSYLSHGFKVHSAPLSCLTGGYFGHPASHFQERKDKCIPICHFASAWQHWKARKHVTPGACSDLG